MFSLLRKKSPLTTLRLYVLQGLDKDRIQRPELLEGVLAAWKGATGTLPADFDIYGPYGIAKGRSVGLTTFLAKLQKKGHSAYSGYSGVDDGSGGLHMSFFETPPYSAAFVEVVLWLYAPIAIDAAIEMVRQIRAVHQIDYGYLTELPSDHDPVSEARIKRGILGGTSVSVGNNSLSKWYQQIQALNHGCVRDIYSLNFLNAKQVGQIDNSTILDSIEATADMYVLQLEDPSERRRVRELLFSLIANK